MPDKTPHILLATAETDAILCNRERKKGAKARDGGKPRSSCPWQGGMLKEVWLSGYDNPLSAQKAIPLASL